MKKGKFVYKNEDCMRRMHGFYDKTLASLGVGYNTPVIIKYPFWQRTFDNTNATYACINFSDAECPEQIKDRSILIEGDIGEVLQDLKGEMK